MVAVAKKKIDVNQTFLPIVSQHLSKKKDMIRKIFAHVTEKHRLHTKLNNLEPACSHPPALTPSQCVLQKTVLEIDPLLKYSISFTTHRLYTRCHNYILFIRETFILFP